MILRTVLRKLTWRGRRDFSAQSVDTQFSRETTGPSSSNLSWIKPDLVSDINKIDVVYIVYVRGKEKEGIEVFLKEQEARMFLHEFNKVWVDGFVKKVELKEEIKAMIKGRSNLES